MQYRTKQIVNCGACAKAVARGRANIAGRRRYKKQRAAATHYTQRPEHARYTKERFKKDSADLSPRYVRIQLAKRSPLKPNDFPHELVEAKRQVLKIQRYLKEAQK